MSTRPNIRTLQMQDTIDRQAAELKQLREWFAIQSKANADVINQIPELAAWNDYAPGYGPPHAMDCVNILATHMRTERAGAAKMADAVVALNGSLKACEAERRDALNTLREIGEAIAPVLDWFQSDEHPPRPTADILRDVVEELRNDRQDVLRMSAALRRCVSALDGLLGDRDLPEDDRPGVVAMREAMAALDGCRGAASRACEACDGTGRLPDTGGHGEPGRDQAQAEVE